MANKKLKYFSQLFISNWFTIEQQVGIFYVNKKKAPVSFPTGAEEKTGSYLLSHTLAYSTIGDERLNCWVRDGIRCFPLSMTARKNFELQISHLLESALEDSLKKKVKSLDRLVLVSSTHHCAYTPNLSTMSSSWGLIGNSYLEGGLAFRCFQRLSFPNIATWLCTWQYNQHTIGSSTSVLSY